jgi:uncharacterized protein YjdB
VTNGLVTAISAGTVTITVTTIDGNKTDECVVTVNTPVTIIPVISVELTEASFALDVTETRRLTARVNPANATNLNVTWISNNEDVATVNGSGVVTAHAAG